MKLIIDLCCAEERVMEMAAPFIHLMRHPEVTEHGASLVVPRGNLIETTYHFKPTTIGKSDHSRQPRILRFYIDNMEIIEHPPPTKFDKDFIRIVKEELGLMMSEEESYLPDKAKRAIVSRILELKAADPGRHRFHDMEGLFREVGDHAVFHALSLQSEVMKKLRQRPRVSQAFKNMGEKSAEGWYTKYLVDGGKEDFIFVTRDNGAKRRIENVARNFKCETECHVLTASEFVGVVTKVADNLLELEKDYEELFEIDRLSGKYKRQEVAIGGFTDRVVKKIKPLER